MSPRREAGDKEREKKDGQVPMSPSEMHEGLTVESGLRGMN